MEPLYVNSLNAYTHANAASAVTTSPKQLAIHLALSAASSLASKTPTPAQGEIPVYTVEALAQEALSLLEPGAELPEDFGYTVGEMYVFNLSPDPYRVLIIHFIPLVHDPQRQIFLILLHFLEV